MNYSDETLMAFVDGELGIAPSAEIENALRADAGLARRVAVHRDLRQRLQSAYRPQLGEPIPDRLLALLTASDAVAARPESEASVISLAAARTARAERGPQRQAASSWPRWGAIAASLFLGVGIGFMVWHANGRGPIVSQQGVLLADGELAQTLSRVLASENTPDATIRVGVSYQSKSGELCRSFGEAAYAGIACRRDAQWRLQMLSRNVQPHEPATSYRTAASTLPPAIEQAIDSDRVGDMLDAKAESEARARGWQLK